MAVRWEVEVSPWVRLVGIGEYELEVQNADLGQRDEDSGPTLIRLQPCRLRRAELFSNRSSTLETTEKSEPETRSCSSSDELLLKVEPHWTTCCSSSPTEVAKLLMDAGFLSRQPPSAAASARKLVGGSLKSRLGCFWRCKGCRKTFAVTRLENELFGETRPSLAGALDHTCLQTKQALFLA